MKKTMNSMNDIDLSGLYIKLIPENHLAVALDAQRGKANVVRVLFEKRKVPETGWSDEMIELIVRHLSDLDSNNFLKTCGVGEREGRIACNLVSRRHYGLSHGIGRSGDITESQPKAAGSSIMSKLTNELLLDLIKLMGIKSTKKSILIPMATGMTISFCLSTLKKQRDSAKYVLWSRIDQKSSFKAMTSANLSPVIIDTKIDDTNGLATDVAEFERQILELGAANIVCIYSTTSCFAPRLCDDILALGVLAKNYDIPHLINNAYGLQSRWISNCIERAASNGRIDIFVQSTDKNLMVPVGGSIICGFDAKIIDRIAANYAGRASSSQTLDVFMTLLSLGRNGYMKLVDDREKIFDHLKRSLEITLGMNVMHFGRNPISMAVSLETIEPELSTMIGSMLYKRGVSGARVVTGLEKKSIEGHVFEGWGSHSTNYKRCYLTVAAGLGISLDDVTIFTSKLENTFKKFVKLQEKN